MRWGDDQPDADIAIVNLDALRAVIARIDEISANQPTRTKRGRSTEPKMALFVTLLIEPAGGQEQDRGSTDRQRGSEASGG